MSISAARSTAVSFTSCLAAFCRACSSAAYSCCCSGVRPSTFPSGASRAIAVSIFRPSPHSLNPSTLRAASRRIDVSCSRSTTLSPTYSTRAFSRFGISSCGCVCGAEVGGRGSGEECDWWS